MSVLSNTDPYQGPQGDQGPTGDKGPIGLTGIKGDPGAKGATGDTGIAGTAGATGASGANQTGIIIPFACGGIVPLDRENDICISAFGHNQIVTVPNFDEISDFGSLQSMPFTTPRDLTINKIAFSIAGEFLSMDPLTAILQLYVASGNSSVFRPLPEFRITYEPPPFEEFSYSIVEDVDITVSKNTRILIAYRVHSESTFLSMNYFSGSLSLS